MKASFRHGADNVSGLVSINGDTPSKLPDFTALSSQIAKITPSGVNSASYSPTNTQAQSCPATGTAWQAASALPPTPNVDLCGCMVKSLSCVAKPDVNATGIGDLFHTVCGLQQGVCDGITANGTTGTYGSYGMCNATEKLSWAFNSYFQKQNSNPSACDFSGAATTQAAASASGNCQALMSQAGSAGTGTVTSAPTGGNGGSSTGTKKAAAGAVTVPRFDFGMLQLGAYVVGAVLTGAGMILL